MSIDIEGEGTSASFGEATVLDYPQEFEQGFEPRAKEDTRFLSAADALDVDLSQYSTALRDGGGFWFEEHGDRWEVVTTRCVELVFTSETGDDAALWRHDDQAILQSADLLIAYHNGAILGMVPIPGLTGAPRTLLVSWSTEPNPLTTGASDALRSEVNVLNVTTGQYEKRVYVHTEIDHGIGPHDCIWFASTAAGDNTHPGEAIAFRFSERFHTFEESYADFVVEEPAPTITGRTNREMPVVPDFPSGLGDAGELVGPVYATVAADCRQNDLILASPVYQWVNQDRSRFPGDFQALESMVVPAPGPGDFFLLGWTCGHRVVPTTCNRLKVRVHIGQAAGGSPEEVGIRVYSMNRFPSPGFNVALESYYVEGSIDTDHGAGTYAGEWVDLGLLPIARDVDNRTWLFVALTEASPAILISLNAVTCDPVFLPGGDGGLGGGGFGA